MAKLGEFEALADKECTDFLTVKFVLKTRLKHTIIDANEQASIKFA